MGEKLITQKLTSLTEFEFPSCFLVWVKYMELCNISHDIYISLHLELLLF